MAPVFMPNQQNSTFYAIFPHLNPWLQDSALIIDQSKSLIDEGCIKNKLQYGCRTGKKFLYLLHPVTTPQL